MSDIPNIPTYADLLKKIRELEKELKKGVNKKEEELPLHYVDYGAGSRAVEHIVKVDESLEKEYWAKLRELPDDE